MLSLTPTVYSRIIYPSPNETVASGLVFLDAEDKISDPRQLDLPYPWNSRLSAVHKHLSPDRRRILQAA